MRPPALLVAPPGCRGVIAGQMKLQTETTGIPPALVLDPGTIPPDDVIFGYSEAMRCVRQTIERVAGMNVPVLVTGESGTGKELIACLLHWRSPWASGPLLKVSCPAIAGTMAEHELFGPDRGILTGVGSGAAASGIRGTLFLDEVGDLPASLQAKLLQLLHDGHVELAEGSDSGWRIVSASNRDLRHEVAAGVFRADLFYRLNAVLVQVPSLRERLEDIASFVTYFLQVYGKKFGRACQPLAPSLLRQLQNFHWPGNIRQLENLVKRYVILDSPSVFENEISQPAPAGDGLDLDFDITGDQTLKEATRRAVHKIERIAIMKALQANNWNRKVTAHKLGISYRALLYKIKEIEMAGSLAVGSERGS